MSKLQQKLLAGAGIGAASIGSAMAAVPAEVTTAFTSISDTATGILGLVWPIATAVTVGFVGLKLFKKGANKAA